MPSIGFSEVASLRLQGISFFLAVLLLSAGIVKLVWNYLGNQFTRLPQLSYLRACGVVTVWGLLFVVVLTMISGARELMTPGAWEKQGITYRIDEPDTPSKKESPQPADDSPLATPEKQLALRRLQLAELRFQLYQFAEANGGEFPTTAVDKQVNEDFWRVPQASGLSYVYVPGRNVTDQGLPLAYEPAFFPGEPLVLLVGGEIVHLPHGRLQESLDKLTVRP